MRRTKRHTLAALTSMLLVIGLLSGCGGSGGNNAGANEPATADKAGSGGTNDQAGADDANKPAEKQTLTLMVGNTGTTLEALKNVAAEAEKKLNIAIEFDIKPDGTEGDNLVKTRLATGDMDDLLVYNTGSLLQALNPGDNFLDLANEPFMSDVMDAFKTVVTIDGKVFGAPVGSSLPAPYFTTKRFTRSSA